MNPTLTKNYKAGAVVAPYRFVKPGADDDHVVQAAANSDAITGVSDTLGAEAAEDRMDVHQAGIVEVEFGGVVTRGGWVTSDAVGKAVASAPAAGANHQVGGRALVSGVAGDIGRVLFAPGQNQG